MKKLKNCLFIFLFNGNLFSAISQTADTVFSFDKSIFASSSRFYLGAAVGATNTDTSALVQASLGVNSVTISSFAEKTALVNFVNTDNLSGADLDAKKVTNPVNNNQIVDLTKQNDLPVVVLKTDTDLGDSGKIAKASTVDTVSTTLVKLKEAAGADSDGILRIVASSGKIFAAIKGASADFGAGESGFAVVMNDSDTNSLVPVNAQTGAAGGNLAKKLINTAGAGAMVAITDVAAITANTVDMYYDTVLDRLYIALKVNSSAGTGGVVALLVARVDSSDSDNPHKLEVDPAVGLASTNFTAASTSFIIGYDQVAAPATTFSNIYKVRTLHTSTNKSYVIVNGGVHNTVTEANIKNEIYALPLVRSSSTTANVGKIAKKSDHGEVVAAASDMTLDTEAAAKVGGGVLPSDIGDDIQEIFVAGDSIFVCLQSATPRKSGIYKSSALLNSNGEISRWTEWQRVMGSADKVFGGGLENNRFMYLTNGTVNNVLKATLWGKGASNGLMGDFVTLMSNQFTSANAGVQGLFDFSETTSSFHPAGEDDSLSMMVATGYKKVALVETGNRTAGGEFTPRTGDFTTDVLVSTDGSVATNATAAKGIVFSGGVLDTLGPICTCDISRVALSATDEKGWLFVGGQNGVAVLSDANGDGWTTATDGGLKKSFVGIIGVGAGTMSFKRLGTITGVRKLACDGTNLYVLTDSSLLKISLSSANFSPAGAAAPTVVTIATASSVTNNLQGRFYDFIVSSKVGFLATSDGLFRVGSGKNIASGTSMDWTEVKVTDGTTEFSLGSVVHLDLLSEKRGGFEEGGNLYALAADLSAGLATAYRFDILSTNAAAVSGTTVLQIQEVENLVYFFSLGKFRSLFRTDGTEVFHQESKHLGDNLFLQWALMQSGMSSATAMRGAKVTLDINEGATNNISLIVRNSASGAWVVPGDFGTQVNE